MKFRKRENCYYISTVNKKKYETTDWIIFYWWQDLIMIGFIAGTIYYLYKFLDLLNK